MNDFEKSYYEANVFWQPEVINNDANKERVLVTSKLVPLDVSSLLDAGCGSGIFLNALSNNRPAIRTMGFDRSEAALKYVNVEKRIGDITAINFPDSSFDCVSCLEVLEHLPVAVYENALNELCRVAKKYILISVPFEERLEEGMNRCPNCLSTFNVDLHLRSFSKKDIEQLLQKQGFRCLSHQLLHKIEDFKGRFLYQKVFFSNYINKWRSPICPICGFSNDKFSIQFSSGQSNTSPKRHGLLGTLKSIPKRFWPKESRYYWIIALYEKS